VAEISQGGLEPEPEHQLHAGEKKKKKEKSEESGNLINEWCLEAFFLKGSKSQTYFLTSPRQVSM